MIIDSFTFTYTRLRYLKVAVESITGFTPDAKSAADVLALTTSAKTALTTALTQKVKAAQARGGLWNLQTSAHETAVMVHACMRSVYRKDRAAMDSIRGIPTEDRTPAQTLQRLRELSAVWAALPDMPDTTEPFAVGAITRVAFDQLITDLDIRISEHTREGALLDNQEAKLRVLNSDLEDFVTAALAQGRAQFRAGTPERAFIEAVPAETSTQKPGQATVTSAQSPEEGAVRLEFDAAHATSFQVWHKGPGAELFVEVGDSIQPGLFTAFGLEGGNHEYKVVGVNSRGEGEASDVATVVVAAVALAA